MPVTAIDILSQCLSWFMRNACIRTDSFVYKEKLDEAIKFACDMIGSPTHA